MELLGRMIVGDSSTSRGRAFAPAVFGRGAPTTLVITGTEIVGDRSSVGASEGWKGS
jgi:hypothetical protein